MQFSLGGVEGSEIHGKITLSAHEMVETLSSWQWVFEEVIAAFQAAGYDAVFEQGAVWGLDHLDAEIGVDGALYHLDLSPIDKTQRDMGISLILQPAGWVYGERIGKAKNTVKESPYLGKPNTGEGTRLVAAILQVAPPANLQSGEE